MSLYASKYLVCMVLVPIKDTRTLIPFRVEGKVSDAIRVSMATGNRLTTHLLQSVIGWLIDTIYTSRSQAL